MTFIKSVLSAVSQSINVVIILEEFICKNQYVKILKKYVNIYKIKKPKLKLYF